VIYYIENEKAGKKAEHGTQIQDKRYKIKDTRFEMV